MLTYVLSNGIECSLREPARYLSSTLQEFPYKAFLGWHTFWRIPLLAVAAAQDPGITQPTYRGLNEPNNCCYPRVGFRRARESLLPFVVLLYTPFGSDYTPCFCVEHLVRIVKIWDSNFYFLIRLHYNLFIFFFFFAFVVPISRVIVLSGCKKIKNLRFEFFILSILQSKKFKSNDRLTFLKIKKK